MITMKIYESENGVFKNIEDAVKYIKETNFEKEVSLYDIDTDKAYNKAKEIYKVIKEYNKDKPLNEQILPTNPFGYRGILGCLGVQAYSISFGTYESNHDKIALFTGYNQNVLDTSKEKSNVMPGMKALSSLSLLASMLH